MRKLPRAPKGKRAVRAVRSSEAIAVRDLADISDLAVRAQGALAFRRELIPIVERFIPHDTILIYSAYSELDPTVECAASGWRPLKGDEGVRFHQEAAARLSAAEMDLVYGARVDAKRLLESRQLAGGSMYREFIEPYRIRACVIRNWPNRYGFFGLAIGRSNVARNFVAGAQRVLHSILPVIQAAEALVRSQSSRPLEDRMSDWARTYRLSAREGEVLAYLTRGLNNREISDLLGISVLTVRNQVASIFRKAAVSSRSELVWVSLTEPPERRDVRLLRSKAR